MFQTVGVIVSVAVGLVALAAAVGLIWSRARVSAEDSTIGVWKGEAEAQKARADRLEDALRELTTRVEHIESENGLLRELVTSKRDIERVAVTVDEIKALVMAMGGSK